MEDGNIVVGQLPPILLLPVSLVSGKFSDHGERDDVALVVESLSWDEAADQNQHESRLRRKMVGLSDDCRKGRR